MSFRGHFAAVGWINAIIKLNVEIQNENGENVLRDIANTCTKVLIEKGIISKSEVSVFIYGFELVLSTALTVTSLLIIGGCSTMWKETITFLMFFMPVRMAAGGYHANTYGRCFLLTNCIFIAFLIICHYLEVYTGKEFAMALIIVSLIYIVANAPITNKKHPVSIQRKEQNRLWTYKIIAIESGVVMLLYFCNINKVICAASVATFFVACMMIAAGKEEDG